MMDEGLLRLIAAQLAHQVRQYGSYRGFYESNLRDRCPRFARLEDAERFRVLVLLCRMPGVAVSIGPLHAWRFHPAGLAPDDAYCNNDQAKTLHRAMEKTA